MSVRNVIQGWHSGQLALFWVAHLAAAWFLNDIGSNVDGWRPVYIVVLMLLLLVAIPVSLFTVTWIWFGGKKRGP